MQLEELVGYVKPTLYYCFNLYKMQLEVSFMRCLKTCSTSFNLYKMQLEGWPFDYDAFPFASFNLYKMQLEVETD